EFNLNLLTRLNREVGADFESRNFEHFARFNSSTSRIEMHLRSLRKQKVEISGRIFTFESNELLHTENSYKYPLQSFLDLAKDGGFYSIQCWTDPDKRFSVHLLGVRPDLPRMKGESS